MYFSEINLCPGNAVIKLVVSGALYNVAPGKGTGDSKAEASHICFREMPLDVLGQETWRNGTSRGQVCL